MESLTLFCQFAHSQTHTRSSSVSLFWSYPSALMHLLSSKYICSTTYRAFTVHLCSITFYSLRVSTMYTRALALSHYFNKPFDFVAEHTHTRATSNSFQFTLTALLNCDSGKSLNISEIHRHAMPKSRTHTHDDSDSIFRICEVCVCSVCTVHYSVRRQWFCHSSCSKQCQWGGRAQQMFYYSLAHFVYKNDLVQHCDPL